MLAFCHASPKFPNVNVVVSPTGFLANSGCVLSAVLTSISSGPMYRTARTVRTP
jgi:hypothetical protein